MTTPPPEEVELDELTKILKDLCHQVYQYGHQSTIHGTNNKDTLYELAMEAKQALLSWREAYADKARIDELEHIKGRKFTDDEMMGMDSKNAQAARAINAFVADIDDRITELKRGKK